MLHRSFRHLSFLAVVAVLSITTYGCTSSQSTQSSTGAATAVTDATHSSSGIEAEVYSTFSGNDARAMAELGQRLENERPPLEAELVSRMVDYLETTPPPDMPLRMMRPMLMRTVAVIVGPGSVPALERCAEESAEYGSLCRDTIAEIGG